MFWVYVIENNNGKIYIGQTANLGNRLKRHNGLLSNKKSSYTSKNKGDWKIVYSEEYKSRNEAVLREKYLKSHVGRDWLRNEVISKIDI